MTGYSASRTVTTVMYQNPGPIHLVESQQTSITVTWKSPSDDSIDRHTFKYAKVRRNIQGCIYSAVSLRVLPSIMTCVEKNPTSKLRAKMHPSIISCTVSCGGLCIFCRIP